MLKVVLIDDEYFFRNSLKHSVDWETYGFSLAGDANNGKSGLDLILEVKPDIAIIDINMPILNGLELIEELNRHKVSCKYILLTGYGEFKYAQKAIHLGVSEYILKPIEYDLLLDALNTLKNEIFAKQHKEQYVRELEEQRTRSTKEKFLLDFLNGHLSLNQTALAPYLANLNIRLHFHHFITILISVSRTSQETLQEILCMIRENFVRTYCSEAEIAELFLSDHSRICILYELNPARNLPEFVKRLQISLHTVLPAEVRCHTGVSSIHHTAESAPLSYEEAQTCLKNAIANNVSVFQYSQLCTTFYHIPEKQLQTLKKLIRLKDSVSIQEELSVLYQSFFNQKLNYDNVIFCTYELLSCLFSAINEKNSVNCFIDESSSSLSDTIRHLGSYEELLHWITDLYLKQITASSADSSSDRSVSRKVELFIQKNYGNPELSIEFIAKNLSMNYSYICYCFKHDHNITINEYINQYRLDQALTLFHSGIANVGYVAEQTGFNNPSYFGKKFKKAYGLSPSEYLKTL